MSTSKLLEPIKKTNKKNPFVITEIEASAEEPKCLRTMFQLPLTDLLVKLLLDRAADGPAVIAVCCSCPFCPSMSAAAAGGAERLSG